MADRNICNVELLDSMSKNTNVIVDENGVLNKLNLYNEISAISTSINGDTLPVESQFYWDKDEEIPTGYVEATPPFSNPNLLINGGFQVWQRGETITNSNPSTTTFSSDRWYFKNSNATSTITKVAKGMQLFHDGTNNFGFYQKIEEKLEEGKTYTLSAIINDVLYQRTFTFATGMASSTENYLNVSDADDFTRFGIIMPAGTWVVQYIKLEVGSIATPFVSRPYQEELMLCQRYYRIGALVGTYTYQNPSDTTQWMLEFSVPQMRSARPTVGLTSVTAYQTSGVGSVPVTSNWWRTNEDNNGMTTLYAYVTVSKASYSFGAVAWVVLDAEIY